MNDSEVTTDDATRPELSVIVCTHNPNADRLHRTLTALSEQTLTAGRWELLVVDNGSNPPLTCHRIQKFAPAARLVAEPRLGLTVARLAGIRAARAEILVLVDDDNVLNRIYLANALRAFAANPGLGAAGGPSFPEFESLPPAWVEEFYSLLALRDLGHLAIIEVLRRSAENGHWIYPSAAPIGAGLVLRRAALSSWVTQAESSPVTDRRGNQLTSGGDNDIILHLLHAGWSVGYFPELELTHLIPPSRIEPKYLARLNYSIQKSWVEVLTRHHANGWSAIPRWTLPLRCARAWFATKAWASQAAHIRWRGLCGHFAGRVSL